MRKRILLASYLFVLFETITAQPRFLATITQYQANIKANRSYVQHLADGSIVTATLLETRNKIELVFLDNCGVLLKRQIIQTDIMNGIFAFVSGDNNTTITLAAQEDDNAFCLFKIGHDGSIIWSKRYVYPEQVRFSSVTVNSQGHVLVGGSEVSGQDAYIVKIDADGEVIWSRKALLTIGGFRLCALKDGGALHVTGSNPLIKWDSAGNIEWALNLEGIFTTFNWADILPVEVSDGYVVAVRLLFDYIHLVKIDKIGNIQWITDAIPTADFGTLSLLTQTKMQKIVKFEGDTLLIAGAFFPGNTGSSNVYTAIHLIDPEGQIVFQNLMQPGLRLYAQDYSVRNKQVAITGWNTQGSTSILNLNTSLALGCGDFQTPALSNPILMLAAEMATIPEVETPVVLLGNAPGTVSVLDEYAVDFICIGNDTTKESIRDTQEICLGDVSYLHLTVPRGTYVVWQDGSTDTFFRSEGAGTFTADIRYCGLEWQHEFVLFPQDCVCSPRFPNAFTPDNDGTNDTFGPIALPECAYSAFEWAIFNRWGERVFLGKDPLDTWDGNLLGGKPAESDVYVWQLHYGLKSGQHTNWFTKSGDVTLLR
jgi:gliding motility-associated-like protein